MLSDAHSRVQPLCLSICLSVCLSVRLSVCLSLCLLLRLFVGCWTCLSLCLSVCLPACLSVRSGPVLPCPCLVLSCPLLSCPVRLYPSLPPSLPPWSSFSSQSPIVNSILASSRRLEGQIMSRTTAPTFQHACSCCQAVLLCLLQMEPSMRSSLQPASTGHFRRVWEPTSIIPTSIQVHYCNWSGRQP